MYMCDMIPDIVVVCEVIYYHQNIIETATNVKCPSDRGHKTTWANRSGRDHGL
jgi:hypothetical protein